MKSNVVKLNDPNANMYGCQPCPKCGSKYRAPYRRPGETESRIECDDCGYKEMVDPVESDDL